MGNPSLGQCILQLKEKMAFASSLQHYTEYHIVLLRCNLLCSHPEASTTFYTDITATKKTSNLEYIEEHGQHTL